MAEAMMRCPDDHPLMVAWKAYQSTDDFANSYKWATAGIEPPPPPAERDPTANRIGPEQYRQYALGSMWAAFEAGFSAAGGKSKLEAK